MVDCGPWSLLFFVFAFVVVVLFFYYFSFSMSELLRLSLRDSKDVKQAQKQNTFNICFLL